MADIFNFPTRAARAPRAAPRAPSVLVAMRHVDLDEAVETVLLLRDSGHMHLLDEFNRGAPRSRRGRRDIAG